MLPPFPYFGGKAAIADLVWQRLGKPQHYIEPFFGGGSVLLAADWPADRLETVNDLDGWLTNFWRAVQHDPDGVAQAADYPVSELDLHARGDWLFYKSTDPTPAEFVERMRADYEYYDVKRAGYWVWGQCLWIGGFWGPRTAGSGISRSAGQVRRQRPHLSGRGQGLNRSTQTNRSANRVSRQKPYLSIGQGLYQGMPTDRSEYIHHQITRLSARLRDVRICCGDWKRIVTPAILQARRDAAVCLDPPYSFGADRDMGLYSSDDGNVAHEVREWCIANGDNPRLRIALCGYADEHDDLMPATWQRLRWRARGGMANTGKNEKNKNRYKEVIWFSPACHIGQGKLFDLANSP